jgi:hypothetical protein
VVQLLSARSPSFATLSHPERSRNVSAGRLLTARMMPSFVNL